MNVNILIAFLNTIRLSAHILIVSADALIVGTHRNKRRRKREYIRFSPVLFFCCHVFTLSHTAIISLKNSQLQAWQQGDNKIMVKKCCHTVKHLVIRTFSTSVTTWLQNTTFLNGCQKESIQAPNKFTMKLTTHLCLECSTYAMFLSSLFTVFYFTQTKLFFSTKRDSGPILNKRSTMLKLGRKPKRDWKTW